MTQLTCPGLPADWINGWLAAVGATVLDTPAPAALDDGRRAPGGALGRGSRSGRRPL